MCHLYASTETCRYDNVTRSVRLQGCVTSVRLEREFWEILDSLAASQKLSTARFISQLYSEVIEEKGEVSNLASLLRVVCAVHLQQSAELVPLPRSACL
ncbi:ribbon-helix-helix domain-containing protein [Salinicola rhizosphaerae]|uniref:Ribbon-helix-helix domain-containing protein n=1 Tax=Salinicola rhizosphaerae TaxID=1443141 RepID=A0ABQ3E1Y7_9GAMM|nr:ribbon-helix-helix domain-containing protein [Salinicola rhizosphaerae]GHB18391.1 hypothetical protein GCM10009038_16780 [Salinicola rhizosphaerae]